MKKPGESALSAAIDPAAGWTVDNYLITELIDRVEVSNWLTIQVNSEKSDMPFPKPYPRPGMEFDEPEEVKFASASEVADLLTRLSGG